MVGDRVVDRRTGGQKRLPMPDGGAGEAYRPLLSLVREEGGDAAAMPGVESREWRVGSRESGVGGAEPTPDADQGSAESPSPPVPPAAPGAHNAEADRQAGAVPESSATRGRARYGLSLQFERREGDNEPGRLVENTIWINEAHPAFRRAHASRSVGYHIALTVALAFAPLAVPSSDEHAFITRFLAEWGDAHDPRAKNAARRGR